MKRIYPSYIYALQDSIDIKLQPWWWKGVDYTLLDKTDDLIKKITIMNIKSQTIPLLDKREIWYQLCTKEGYVATEYPYIKKLVQKFY